MVFFASLRFVRFLCLFARIGNAKTVRVFGVLRASFFSLEKEREKTVPTREIYTRALGRERDATKTRAKKRQRRVAYLFFRTNSICAKGVCACVRAPKSSSRGKRARVWQKTLCGDCFPLKKRKISWLLPLFFAPCALFFSFLGSFFSLFWQKMAGNSFLIV